MKTQKQHPEYLGIYTYPNAYQYSDKTTINPHTRDYHCICTLYFNPLNLAIWDYSDKYKKAVQIAKNELNNIIDNIGKPIQISQTGQITYAKL